MAMQVSEMARRCHLQFFLLFCFYPLLQLLPGLADDSPKNETNAVHHSSSRNSVGITILLFILGLLSVVGFSLFLFKIWQRKKRDEQQARLLKLFENDDELEVELGIRD